MNLNELTFDKGSNYKAKRVGRGIGCGKGKTCGRGHKGQNSRSGVAVRGKGFEGGQTPLFIRLPKRGFSNEKFNQKPEIVNVGAIQGSIDLGKINAKTKINAEILFAAGLIRKAASKIKILSEGDIKSKIEIDCNFISESAKEKISVAGGKFNVI